MCIERSNGPLGSFLFALFVLLLCVTSLWASPPSLAPGIRTGRHGVRELGKINWIRGFHSAVKKAQSNGKPLLVLFQEVPGCQTCIDYGNQVLSHPLIVEAVENLFVPVAIYNNVKGSDQRVLKSFSEKAWSNPVVRIMTVGLGPLSESTNRTKSLGAPPPLGVGDGSRDRSIRSVTNLAVRLANDYSVGGLASAMVEALVKSHREAPVYLRLVAEEYAARKQGLAKAAFAMHCFWEGEGALGKISGVISTRPGFLNEKEVVEVQFDPSTISYAALVQAAKGLKCADQVFARDKKQQEQAVRLVGGRAVQTDQAVRPDKQPKYYLSQTAYRYVPMTELQASRINSAIGEKKSPQSYLSPRQIKLLSLIKRYSTAKWPDAVGADDLTKAWLAAQRVARAVRQ